MPAVKSKQHLTFGLGLFAFTGLLISTASLLASNSSRVAASGAALAQNRAHPSPQLPARPPTFARDIAPIIYQHCATCHHSSVSGISCGTAPFALLTYNDVKQYAGAIATATSNRAMPPWLPEPGYGDFSESPRLSQDQIRLIADWVRNGEPEGDPAEIPPAPHFEEGWQLGKPDLVLDAKQAISVPASGPDVFWNLIFSPGMKTKRYVRAIEVHPGSDVNLIHHANVILDPAQSARALETAPGAGFPGMDLALKQSPFYVPSHFLFWKPGSAPWVEPDGLSWELDPGADLVLNAHFMPMGTAEQVKPSIGLYFTDQPPKLFPMLIELENDDALDIPAGERDFSVGDDFRLPRDVDVLAVYPHAHYLGHLLESYATLPNGQRQWLIRIPQWNSDWQGVYHYRKPVFLPKGTVISMRYHYDNSTANSHNPHNPPQRVVGGNQATDEMAHLWFQILPRGEGDGRMEIESALLQHRVEKFSDDFPARLNLGALMLARSDAAGAVDVLEQAVRLDPKQEDARRGLAMALDGVGRLREAVDQYRAAVALKPDDNQARLGLARGLIRSGNLTDGLENFRKVADAEPRDADLRDEFGILLMRQNHPAEALAQFNSALAIDPTHKAAQADREEALKRLQAD
jgi:Flp pilus assembly protein TadD/mono/diheme cytochrome c family protein